MKGHTVVEMEWPEQLENGKLLNAAEQSGFDVMVTSDQNIRYQQNMTGFKDYQLKAGRIVCD